MREGCRLAEIDDSNWREFVSLPEAVLVLSVSTCPACAAWEDEIREWLEAGGGMRVAPEAEFGKLVLDSDASVEFKRVNEWLDEVPGLPFTAIFVSGSPRTSLAGGGISRLERRLDGLRESLDSEDSEAATLPRDHQQGAGAPQTAHGATEQGGQYV
jgi:hypothetical protein